MLLLMLLASAPTNENFVAKLVEAWQAVDKPDASLKWTWHVLRDSRTENFGTEELTQPRSLWTTQLAGDRCRIDGEGLTILGRNQRWKPAESAPNRARLEFRYVLLEERLAGQQTIPIRRSVSAIVERHARLPSKFSDLECWLAIAPLLAVHPTFLITPHQLVAAECPAAHPSQDLGVLIVERPAEARWKLWVERHEPYRIYRIIEEEKGRTAGQVDLIYDNSASRIPKRWTALQLDTEQNVVEFATAALEDSDIDVTMSDELFRVPMPMAIPESNRDWRRCLRAGLDWAHLALPLLMLMRVIWLFARRTSPWPINSIWRTVLTLAMTVALGVELRSLPVAERPLIESFDEITELWDQSRGFESNWESDKLEVSQRMAAISEELRADQVRAELFSFQQCFGGRFRPTEMARKDLIRVASIDFPAFLNERSGRSEIRSKLIEDQLAKVGDHLAGISPYVLPLKKRRGIVRWSSLQFLTWLDLLVVVECFTVVVALIWYLRQGWRACKSAAQPKQWEK